LQIYILAKLADLLAKLADLLAKLADLLAKLADLLVKLIQAPSPLPYVTPSVEDELYQYVNLTYYYFCCIVCIESRRHCLGHVFSVPQAHPLRLAASHKSFFSFSSQN
jgi:hypothetical protein